MNTAYSAISIGAALIAVAIPIAVYSLRYVDPFIRCALFGTEFDRTGFAQEQRKRGHVFFTVTVFGPVWNLVGEHAGKWLLVKEKNNLLAGGSTRSKGFNKLLGGSLIDLDFADHTQRRRLLAPAFKSDVLRNYLPKMVRDAHNDLEHWVKKAQESGYVDLQQEIKQLTLRFAFTLLMGADLSNDDHETAGKMVSRYSKFLLGLFPWPVGTWNALDQATRARQNMVNDVMEVVRKRRALIESGAKPEFDDPLWLLMNFVDEDGKRLSDEQLGNESVLLVFAGHETTALTLTSFAVQCLRDPALVARLRSEQDALATSHPMKDGFYTNDHLKHMPLLEATFRECERLFNVVPSIVRQANADLVYNPPDGSAPVVFRKGTKIGWSITGTNRDPDLYKDPDTFNLDRWLEPAAPGASAEAEGDLGAVKVSSFKLGTFGAGHRMCLGMQFARMEMMAIGGLLIRDYDWSQMKPGTRLKQKMMPQLQWIDGVNVEFKHRVAA